MNNEIKKILKKHLTAINPLGSKLLNDAIIEICELQKQSIVSELEDVNYESAYWIDNYSKNIAE